MMSFKGEMMSLKAKPFYSLGVLGLILSLNDLGMKVKTESQIYVNMKPFFI